MQAISPFAKAGFRILEASKAPPETAPAPMIVWISSMKRMACFFSFDSFDYGFLGVLQTLLGNVSPASKPPISKEKISRSFKLAGISWAVILAASPFRDGSFTYTGITHEDGIIFTAPR